MCIIIKCAYKHLKLFILLLLDDIRSGKQVTCENWHSHSDYHQVVEVLRFGAMWRWKTTCFSKTSASTYKSTQHQNRTKISTRSYMCLILVIHIYYWTPCKYSQQPLPNEVIKMWWQSYDCAILSTIPWTNTQEWSYWSMYSYLSTRCRWAVTLKC